MGIYATVLVAVTSAMCASGLSDIDRVRAHTPLPRRHLTAETPLGRHSVMNDALLSRAGGDMQTRACEDFSDAELIDMWTTLRASTNDELSAIYESTNDKRVLSNMPAEEIVFTEDPRLLEVMRAAVCIEAVNMYVHHLDEGAKEEFHALSAVPLMPEQHWEHRVLRNIRHKSQNDVRRRYQAVQGGYMCHGPTRGPGVGEGMEGDAALLQSPNAPVAWAPVYEAVLAVNQTDFYGEPADGRSIRTSSILRWYDWNLGATRSDLVSGDGDGIASVGLHLRSTGLRYMFSPADRTCLILPLYVMGPTGPNWMRSGMSPDIILEENPWRGANNETWPGGPDSPYGNDRINTFRIKDQFIRHEIEVEKWTKYDFESFCAPSSHSLFHSKADGRPIMLQSWGGVDSIHMWNEFVAYTPVESIDPEIFAVPEYCTDDTIIELPIDDDCGTVDNVSMMARAENMLKEKVHMKRAAVAAAAAAESESSARGEGSIAGIIAAGAIGGAVAVVVAGVAARRFTSTPQFAPLFASLKEEGYSVEMGASDMSLSRPDASTASC